MFGDENIRDPLREPLREPLRNSTLERWATMTDEEILREMNTQEEQSQHYVPEHIVPEGMKYQWMAFEVYGQPNNARIAQVEQNGWQAVPASRHDGMFMPPGTSGPIQLAGLRLYELPMRFFRLRREAEARRGLTQVAQMNEHMKYAPPGTATRDAPGLNNVIRHESGAVAGTLVVE